ncbi:MAG TPA: hypothetical protein VJB18_02855 [Burkholderiales bacterium]|nr:hypothetical protein [Burkholderiales bacterium]
MNNVQRAYLVLFLALAILLMVLSLPPIAQDPSYHDFADRRGFLGIPNFLDVTTNLAFLAVGIAGIGWCANGRGAVGARWSWMACFIGVVLVSAGSGYYHLAPDNGTLVWDRVPMSVGFMGLLVAVLAEHLNLRLEKILLTPAILLGIASVVVWHVADDLRLYAWIQFMPLLVMPAVLLLFDSPYTHRRLLLVALAIYAVAKLAEHYDRAVFAVTGEIISGHSLKHLLAALALFVVYGMLRRRTARDLN